MQITVVFEMDEKTAKFFLQSSIERVINTSVRIAEQSPHDDATINTEDWEEWKPVVCSMWSGLHNKIYRELTKCDFEDTQPVVTLRKGDV